MLSKINVDRVVKELREAMTELPFDDEKEENKVNQVHSNHQYSTRARYKFLVRAVEQTVDYITGQLDGLTDRELQLFIQILATSLRFEYGFTKMEGSANEK